ncbi:PREDICTED: histone-lysine N-methyltransferase SMYD3-like [Priapulus caudatus]|uniref:Histone-lysine N-methyltransferase SMYD3-like n=1 Tax=Priapulus caudatus TaxID=37621 RepID=A0ABM1E3A2_PRICU|nr:PREDICTED: histone-lysine N-methyltransferase SMYD3-like [Priapulus caudatus]
MAKQGTVLMTALPFCHVLYDSERGKRCDECFELRPDQLKRCVSCKFVSYCNKTCQQKDWLDHKKECHHLRRIASVIPIERARLISRILYKIKRGVIEAEEWNQFDDYPERTIHHVISHRELIKQDPDMKKKVATILFETRRFMGKDTPSDDDILNIYGKLIMNAFVICDEINHPIYVGCGMYIGPCIMDHSCCPNAIITFSGIRMNVRAGTDIAVNNHNHAFISYVDLLAPRQERRAQLQPDYYFFCECTRCLDDSIDELMLSTKCPNNNCEGVIIKKDGEFQPCETCGAASFSSIYATLAAETAQWSAATFQRLQRCEQDGRDPAEILAQCEECLRGQDEVLHPVWNVHRIRLMDLAAMGHMRLEQWAQAAQCILVTLPAKRKYFPANHPNLSLQLFSVGKALIYAGRCDDALPHLHEALDMISATHGNEHPLVEQVEQLLTECKSEIKKKAAATTN